MLATIRMDISNMCRDLLLMRDLGTISQEGRRQQWVEHATNLSIYGRKDQEIPKTGFCPLKGNGWQ